MKFSIITINLNNKDGLQKTIDSVLCQTWKDYEWIIIDGGSTDGSKELIEQYQQHFAYWCSEPDNGVYNAMNKGIAKAKGEYLNFMNSGDAFCDKEVLMQVSRCNRSDDVIYGDSYGVRGDKKILWQPPSDITLDFFYSQNICHQAMFVKSAILKVQGYDESYKILGDWAKWVTMYIEGCSFYHLPLVICLYDLDGISGKGSPQERDEKERVRNKIPQYVRVVLERNVSLKRELKYYQKSKVIQDVKALDQERLLNHRCLQLAILCLKALRKIINLL